MKTKWMILGWMMFMNLPLQMIAQIQPLTTEPDGGNKRAWVAEQIGIVIVQISYSRPGVKGREGAIWGTPVAHYGLIDLGHGTSNAAPWRAGANENTTIEFSHQVMIEGQKLPAGKYGFSIINGEEESTLVFSNNSDSWGSFYYDPQADALRVTVQNKALEESVEWLRYDFTDQTENSAVIALSWEKRMIPFKVEADTQKLQIAAFVEDFKTTRPPDDYIQAANYCLLHNIALDTALAWMDRAIYFRVMGQKTFRTLGTKSAILLKLGRTQEAEELMKEAVPLGTAMDVHFYARTLLTAGQKKEAFDVFKSNYEKFPDEFVTNVGMGRAHSAMKEFKKAGTYLQQALPKAPDNLNKTSVERMIQDLSQNRDINEPRQ
jgi:tetratricopeptide (TPR) repeat protein